MKFRANILLRKHDVMNFLPDSSPYLPFDQMQVTQIICKMPPSKTNALVLKITTCKILLSNTLTFCELSINHFISIQCSFIHMSKTCFRNVGFTPDTTLRMYLLHKHAISSSSLEVTDPDTSQHCTFNFHFDRFFIC